MKSWDFPVLLALLAYPLWLEAKNQTAPHSLLEHYEGDFTDSDGDGMTDLAELKYGFDPSDSKSFPKYEFESLPRVEYPIKNSGPSKAVVVKTDRGIVLEWDNKQQQSSYGRFSLTLESGGNRLYYGGHGWEEASVDYDQFDLNGTEILRGRFSEYDPLNGSFVAYCDWFEIDLLEFPLVRDTDLAAPEDQITFRFDGFENSLQKKYERFLAKTIPILRDVAGNPAETFVCTIKMGGGGGAWITLDQGRTILVDDSWIPRLLIHELIHVWKGKYAFSYTGESWSYEDDLNGFEEIAEGLAYEVLHDYVEAYPSDEVSVQVLEKGPWWNWASHASNYDLVKHQRHTGAGTFWSGEMLFQNDRYSISAMLIQNLLQHDPAFYRKVMKAYYQKIESDPAYRPSKQSLLDLWSSVLPKINGIESRDYLEAIPVLNGTKLKQGYYPVLYQHESSSGGTTKTIFGSYALDGYLWWHSGNTRKEISSFDLPSWVQYNSSSDGYLYVDSNGEPYRVTTKNVYGEIESEHMGILDAGYQDENRTIPNNLFNERISDLDSINLPQGLYLETLEFTEIAQHTTEASQTFYSFGYQKFSQSRDEYSLFFGVDSKFPERVTVAFESLCFDLSLINGCAILKTDLLAHNAEGILTIEVHSKDSSQTYSRALINAGSHDGKRHQQFLIIDRDFDGVEDLYDDAVDESAIDRRYEEYRLVYPEPVESNEMKTIEVLSTSGGMIVGEGSYEKGSEVRLRASPEPGYRFVNWVGGLSGTESLKKFIAAENLKVGAVFSKVISGDKEKTNQSVEQTKPIIENSSTTPFWISGKDLGANWKHLDWFGHYLIADLSTPWVYHSTLGWAYLTENSTQTIWIYTENTGWIWTLPSLFPQGYHSRKGNWVYFEKDRYFDYANDAWVRIEG